MPRTPLRRPVLNRLAGINDQLCFFLFAEAEVEQTLSHFPVSLDASYSTDLFPHNPHARRIYVPLGSLSGFQLVNRTFTLGSYFSASYEVLAGYCDPALRLLDRLRSQPLVRSTDSQVEERFAGTLLNAGLHPPASETIDTLKYMRLRRNHFVHLAEDVRPKFERLLKRRGDALNAFWRDSREPIDFRDPSFLETFTADETISLLKLCRLALEQLDDAAVAGIELPYLIDYEAASGPKQPPAQKAPEVVGRIHHAYGIDLDVTVVQARLSNGDPA